MAKHRSPKNENQASVGKSLTVEVPLPVLGVLGETREAFHALCIRTGQQVLRAMMEADRGGVVRCEGPASGGPAVLARGEHRKPGDAWGPPGGAAPPSGTQSRGGGGTGERSVGGVH